MNPELADLASLASQLAEGSPISTAQAPPHLPGIYVGAGDWETGSRFLMDFCLWQSFWIYSVSCLPFIKKKFEEFNYGAGDRGLER